MYYLHHKLETLQYCSSIYNCLSFLLLLLVYTCTTSSYLTVLIILSNIFALSSLLISSTIDTNNCLAKLILCSVCSIFISNLSRPSSNFFSLLLVIGSSFANILYKCEYDTSTFFATSLRLIALLSIFSLYKLMISSLVIYTPSSYCLISSLINSFTEIFKPFAILNTTANDIFFLLCSISAK